MRIAMPFGLLMISIGILACAPECWSADPTASGGSAIAERQQSSENSGSTAARITVLPARTDRDAAVAAPSRIQPIPTRETSSETYPPYEKEMSREERIKMHQARIDRVKQENDQRREEDAKRLTEEMTQKQMDRQAHEEENGENITVSSSLQQPGASDKETSEPRSERFMTREQRIQLHQDRIDRIIRENERRRQEDALSRIWDNRQLQERVAELEKRVTDLERQTTSTGAPR